MFLELYRDEAGDPRARADRDREALAQFLESDVQGSTATGREILEAIDAVAEGRLREWTRTGNACTLVLTAEGAAIEPDFDEESEADLVPLTELREAVARWIEFLDEG
jgi:uncharacterized protein YacL (UPF0231 family)